MRASQLNAMNGSRIDITGIGVLSPNGIGRDSCFTAPADSRSGTRTLTQFGAPCRIVGEVDFNRERWVDAKNIRHVSQVVPMPLAATDEALPDAKLDLRTLDLETRRNIGVMLGGNSASGCTGLILAAVDRRNTVVKR